MTRVGDSAGGATATLLREPERLASGAPAGLSLRLDSGAVVTGTAEERRAAAALLGITADADERAAASAFRDRLRDERPDLGTMDPRRLAALRHAREVFRRPAPEDGTEGRTGARRRDQRATPAPRTGSAPSPATASAAAPAIRTRSAERTTHASEHVFASAASGVAGKWYPWGGPARLGLLVDVYL